MVLQARLPLVKHQAFLFTKDFASWSPRYSPTNETNYTTEKTSYGQGFPVQAWDHHQSQSMEIVPAGRIENGDVVRVASSGNHSNRSTPTKRRKIELTLDWLDENYMVCEGVCLARCILYNHYLDFCRKNNIEPACAATFGKTIRRKFPDITTRRLGTRGHSKYHYYGIGIRESSIYYNSVFAGKGLTRFSPKGRNEETMSVKHGTNFGEDVVKSFGEDFPDISLLCQDVGNGLTRDDIQSIATFYKSFCQTVLGSAVSQPLETVHGLILRCWNDFPPQYLPCLTVPIVVDIICLYDSLLCETLIDILLPTPCENLTELQLFDVRNIGKQWEDWVKTSSVGMPELLVGKRVDIAQRFAQSIVRQTTFVNLSKTVRSVVANPQLISEMIRDFSKVDLRSIVAQSFYPNVGSEEQDSDFNSEHLCQLKDLINKQAGVDMFVEWLDTVVDQKVIKPSKQNGRSMKKRAHDFLLKWSFFEARIMHNLTINNANSINSFHYLRMMMDEYIWFAIETQFNNEKKQELRNMVSKNIKQTKAQPQSGAIQQGCSSRAMMSPNSDFSCPESMENRTAWDEPFTYGNVQGGTTFSNLYENPIKMTETCESPYAQPNSQFYFEPTEPFVLTDTPQDQLTYTPQYSDQAYTSPSRSGYVYHNGSTFAYLSNATTRNGQPTYAYPNVNPDEGFSPNPTGYYKTISPNKRSYCAMTNDETSRIKSCSVPNTTATDSKLLCSPSSLALFTSTQSTTEEISPKKGRNVFVALKDNNKTMSIVTSESQSSQIVFDDLTPNLAEFQVTKEDSQALTVSSYSYSSTAGTSSLHAAPNSFVQTNSSNISNNASEVLLTPNGYDCANRSPSGNLCWSMNPAGQMDPKAEKSAVLSKESNSAEILDTQADNLPAITSMLGP